MPQESSPTPTRALQVLEQFKLQIMDSKIAFHPNIPAKMLDRVVATYAKMAKERNEVVLCVVNDTLVAGNASDGLVITSEAIYWHNYMEWSNGAIQLTDVSKVILEKRMLERALLINDKHRIRITGAAAENVELLVQFINVLRDSSIPLDPAMVKPGTDAVQDSDIQKQPVETPVVIERKSAQANTTGAKQKKKGFLGFSKTTWLILVGVSIWLILVHVLKLDDVSSNLTDASVAYKAAAEQMQKQGIDTDTVYCYCLKIHKDNGEVKVGNLYINKEIIQYVFGKQVISSENYAATVKIISKKAQVLKLVAISDFPEETRELDFEFTAYGDRRSKENAVTVVNGLNKW